MEDAAQGQILAAFQQFNTEKGKALEWESLVHVLKLLGPGYPDKEARAALQASGKLRDGKITYEDFVDWIFGSGADGTYVVDESVKRFLVDNTHLKNASKGLAYRSSADFEDRTGPETIAPWNTEVSGVFCENGFVDVGGLFLPVQVGGHKVLIETGKGYALGQCRTCTALGREPFFCHYRRFVEGCPVQVARTFQSINEQKVLLEVGMRGVVLEVDADGDRRVQFSDFQEPQWVEAEHSLFLDVLPSKEADQVVPEDIIHAFKRCDLRGDGLVHLGALRNILGAEVVDTLAEELDTIPDATGRQGQDDSGGYLPKELPPEPHLFVQYDDLVAWMFDNQVAKAVKCRDGHKMEINADDKESCSVCHGVGTTYWCKSCCELLVNGWRMCFACHEKALGKNPDFGGKWLDANGEIGLVHGSKVTPPGHNTLDLMLEDDNKCRYVADGMNRRGFLVDRGMKIKWDDGSSWSRCLRDAYIKQVNKVDVRTALKKLVIPTCKKCNDHNSVEWSKKLKGYPESGWKCSQNASCGSVGEDGRNPWRWNCDKCKWDLCVHCGPLIPVTMDCLRPVYVPPWCEWLTAGPPALARDVGKYYYEVRLGYGMNSPHVGFLTTEFSAQDFDGHGVGTEANGWAADGLRHKKWHAGCVPASWPRDWQIGDVIGAAIDIRGGRVIFSLNGEWNEESSLIFLAGGRSFYPAVSMNGNWHMNIPSPTWRYAPPDTSFLAFADEGVFKRPIVAALAGGDRLRVQRSCQSNSSEAIDLAKGELGTVRYADEDGDALIDFDSRTKGEWLFANAFLNLLKLDTFSAISFGESTSEEALQADEADKVRWNNTLVGLWDFVGGSFEIEDRGENTLFFYDSELVPEGARDSFEPSSSNQFGESSNWLKCTLPKTQISYRLQLNQAYGNTLVWQEMAKGSDVWERTEYATRRGRLSDHLPVLTTTPASIWSSVTSGIEIGVVPQGVVLNLAGPRQQGDGLWMAPLRPRGAIECRCIREFEPMSPAIQAVDTNVPEGRYRTLARKDKEASEQSFETLRYVSLDSIWQALEHVEGGVPAGTVLIKGSWLQALAADDVAQLPRRQDLPDDAVWEPLELQRLVEAKRVEIVAVSYCWLSSLHPDPEGTQLNALAEIIEQRLDCDSIPVDDIALFVDWCSLKQNPQNPRDTKCFEKGIESVSLWFAHAQTYVWMLTAVPDGIPVQKLHDTAGAWTITEYSRRGWQTFEHRLTDMLTENYKVLDLTPFDEDTCTTWFETCKMSHDKGVKRRPPVVPEVFAAELEAQVFTKLEDSETLKKLYSQTFTEIMSVVKVLKYKAVGWTMQEVATFADTLPHCRNLSTLSLTENAVGSAGSGAAEDMLEMMPVAKPVAAIALAAHLPKCQKLRRCLLRACNIGDMDMVILAPSLAQCVSLATLNLMDNKIGADGVEALAKALPDCPSLRQLILAGNNIGVEGAMQLAEFAPRCETLLELWLTGCGFLGQANQVLKEQWKDGGKAIADLHF